MNDVSHCYVTSSSVESSQDVWECARERGGEKEKEGGGAGGGEENREIGVTI